MQIQRLIVTGLAAIVIAIAGVTRVLAPVGAQTGERPLTHTVQPGETLYRIARQFGLPVEDLMSANNLAQPNVIVVGQVLVIPRGGAAVIEAVDPAPDLGIVGPNGQHVALADDPPPILSDPRDTIQPDLGILGAAPGEPAPAAPVAVPAVAEPEEPSLDSAPAVDDGADPPAERERESADVGAPDVQAEAPLRDPRDITDPSVIAPDLGILAPPENTALGPEAPLDDTAPLAEETIDPPAESTAAEVDPPGEQASAVEVDSADEQAAGIRDPRDVTDPSVLAPDMGILAPEAATWLINGSIISTGGPVVRATYQLGQELGNNPHAFSKIGDCNSEPPFYLVKFDEGAYDLGPYGYLQPAIDHFTGSFARKSATVWTGNHAWAVFDPTWANPAMCLSGESPIECEFRVNRPSIVLIRLGTNEANTPDLFETNLRKIIEFSLERGTIPVLGTKADRLEGSDAINDLIRALADEYKVPLWDFGRAADNIPGRGLRADGFHMTFGSPYYSDPAALLTGHAVHNLTALMALDAVWRSATE
jgi:LysM repeat protein